MSATVITVDSANLAKQGFFCYMSKRKNPGWAEKAAWLNTSFDKGLTLRILELPDRGFIEYLPIESSLRPVLGSNYMLIHCLWIVGKSKGRGYAKVLLEQCIADARHRGMDGVAMVASAIGYMKWKDFLTSQGFQSVDSAAHSYELMALPFNKQPAPRFCGDWERKAAQCGPGLTILKTRQCPYFHDFTLSLEAQAEAKQVPVHIVNLENAQAVRDLAPTPFGTYNVVINGTAVPIFYDAAKALAAL